MFGPINYTKVFKIHCYYVLLDDELEMVHHQNTLKTESAKFWGRGREEVGGGRTMSRLTEC